jgi:hypothetical protein
MKRIALVISAVSLSILLSAAASTDSTDPKNADVRPSAAETAYNDPFSLEYSLSYSPNLTATGDVQCSRGYAGVLLKGHFNEKGDPVRHPVQWIAHIDAPGNIHWAARLGDDTTAFLSELTCRGNVIYAAYGTAPNRGCIGKFAAASLAPIKTIQFGVAPVLNDAFFEFHRESLFPIAVSIIQDSGDGATLTVISENLEIAFSKFYSVPAFAIKSRDPFKRLTRYRMFRAQDNAGYYLVITDVKQISASATGEATRVGILRLGVDGALKWGRLYSFSAHGFGPLGAKVASDGAILGAAAYGAMSEKSLLVKIAPDGTEAWAKILGVPNATFNDFHCDATPYRFVEPNLKAIGMTVSRGVPQTILLALDYATGEILYQTRFPGIFNGGGAYSDQNANSIYVSTLGLQYARAGLKGIASISRFDHQLRLVAAKEIVGAESSFPLLTCGSNGTNELSYDFSKPFRGVACAVNENLEPVDRECHWARNLSLTMERCSYSEEDVQCKVESLEVDTGNGTAVIGPAAFPLLNLALKIDSETRRGATAVQDPSPIERYSYLAEPKTTPSLSFAVSTRQMM